MAIDLTKYEASRLAFKRAKVELRGTLVLEGRCLRVRPDDGYGDEAEPSYMIVWPPHVSLDEGRSGPGVIDHESGVRARVGAPVLLGGGEIMPGVPVLDGVDPSFLEECGGPLWLASGLASPPSREVGADTTILFPQVPEDPDGVVMEALLSGTLVLEGRCLRVESDYEAEPDYVVVWPAYVSLDESASPPTVIDHESGVRAQVGGPVSLGGGETTAAHVASEGVNASFLEECEGPLWLAGGLVSPEDR